MLIPSCSDLVFLFSRVLMFLCFLLLVLLCFRVPVSLFVRLPVLVCVLVFSCLNQGLFSFCFSFVLFNVLLDRFMRGLMIQTMPGWRVGRGFIDESVTG